MLFNIFILMTSGLLLFWLFKPIDHSNRNQSNGYMEQNEIHSQSVTDLQAVNRLNEFDELNVLIHNVNYGEAKSNV